MREIFKEMFGNEIIELKNQVNELKAEIDKLKTSGEEVGWGREGSNRNYKGGQTWRNDNWGWNGWEMEGKKHNKANEMVVGRFDWNTPREEI